MSRNVNVVILCEDRQHEAFARRFLEQTGRSRRIQRVVRSPKGHGSAEEFVRKRFGEELAYYRQRQHRVEQALVVLIDADGQTVNATIMELENAADAGGQGRRRPDERVAIFVPAWNIETWFAYLAGREVSEDENTYPRLKRERDCTRHVDILHQMCQQRVLRQPAPSSLEAACVEYRSRLQA